MLRPCRPSASAAWTPCAPTSGATARARRERATRYRRAPPPQLTSPPNLLTQPQVTQRRVTQPLSLRAPAQSRSGEGGDSDADESGGDGQDDADLDSDPDDGDDAAAVAGLTALRHPSGSDGLLHPLPPPLPGAISADAWLAGFPTGGPTLGLAALGLPGLPPGLQLPGSGLAAPLLRTTSSMSASMLGGGGGDARARDACGGSASAVLPSVGLLSGAGFPQLPTSPADALAGMPFSALAHSLALHAPPPHAALAAMPLPLLPTAGSAPPPLAAAPPYARHGSVGSAAGLPSPPLPPPLGKRASDAHLLELRRRAHAAKAEAEQPADHRHGSPGSGGEQKTKRTRGASPASSAPPPVTLGLGGSPVGPSAFAAADACPEEDSPLPGAARSGGGGGAGEGGLGLARPGGALLGGLGVSGRRVPVREVGGRVGGADDGGSRPPPLPGWPFAAPAGEAATPPPPRALPPPLPSTASAPVPGALLPPPPLLLHVAAAVAGAACGGEGAGPSAPALAGLPSLPPSAAALPAWLSPQALSRGELDALSREQLLERVLLLQALLAAPPSATPTSSKPWRPSDSLPALDALSLTTSPLIAHPPPHAGTPGSLPRTLSLLAGVPRPAELRSPVRLKEPLAAADAGAAAGPSGDTAAALALLAPFLPQPGYGVADSAGLSFAPHAAQPALLLPLAPTPPGRTPQLSSCSAVPDVKVEPEPAEAATLFGNVLACTEPGAPAASSGRGSAEAEAPAVAAAGVAPAVDNGPTSSVSVAAWAASLLRVASPGLPQPSGSGLSPLQPQTLGAFKLVNQKQPHQQQPRPASAPGPVFRLDGNDTNHGTESAASDESHGTRATLGM
jgi:hypothetical protein